MFRRLGVKWMLVVGMAAWVVRYALFASAAPNAVFWMIALGILLHGICYDFFFVTGQIYIDKKSTPAIRGQAQGFFVLVTYGVGMLIGAQIAGNVYNRFLAGAPALTLAAVEPVLVAAGRVRRGGHAVLHPRVPRPRWTRSGRGCQARGVARRALCARQRGMTVDHG